MVDYLDEDPVITKQQYAIMSYVLPKDPSDSPMVKFRGAFSSVEECKNKIQRLQSIDTYFNMYIIEVGKWGALLTNEALENEDLTQEYKDEKMNDMMKAYKQERDKAADEFEKRKREMVNKAKEEGSPEGQKKLAEQEEHPLSIKKRLVDTQEIIEKIKKDLDEFTKIHEDTKNKYDALTEEQLRVLEEELKKLEV